MDIFREFSRETRANLRPALKTAGLLFCIPFFTIVLILSGYFIYMLLDNRGMGEDIAEQIPLESLVAAHVQSFNCIHDGPDECEVYNEATDYLVRTSPEEGMTYTPLNEDDPGEVQEDGTHLVVLSGDLSEDEWEALAESATLNGEANTSTVTENTVEPVSETAGQFLFSDSDDQQWLGQVELELNDSGVALSSITYESAE